MSDMTALTNVLSGAKDQLATGVDTTKNVVGNPTLPFAKPNEFSKASYRMARPRTARPRPEVPPLVGAK